MKFTKFGLAATAAYAAMAMPALAQNNASATDVVEPVNSVTTEPATTRAVPPPPPAPAPDPAPITTTASEPIVTTTTVPVTIPEIEDPLDNPYANSYNELLPLEVEEDRGFDDWGLLGLLGLLGLFGLKRRERLVYVEPAPHVARTSTQTVVHDTPPPAGPIA